MKKRIENLTNLTLKGEMYAHPVATEFNHEDLFLSRQQMESQRLCEYILNQEPVLTEYSKMTGFFNCDSSVVGDAFRRMGHKAWEAIKNDFYLKAIDNLSTFEWQHATADYKKVLDKGVKGIIEEIDDSLKLHTETEEIEFLNALKRVANTLIAWAHKCSDKALELSKTLENTEHKKNLENLSKALLNVPENKPKSFYEAVLTIYVCFSADPDSVGTLDRYLRPFYEHDIENGVITREEAKEYLQELFLMLQAATPVTSPNFTRGAESHFCIGGYLENGEDGFNDLSRLIVEALMELPTWIPQISLRWTKKTPREVLRFMLDCERKDNHKRIAFVNDEPRIKGLMEYTGLSYNEAVNYTMIGCNELALPGGMVLGFDPFNIVRSVENTFYKREDALKTAQDFETVYHIYEQELFSDLWAAEKIGKGFQEIRSRDCNLVSNIFLEGPIEKAKSCTQGGLTKYIAVGLPIGLSNVIDSLSVTKQFVFDEKIITIEELLEALKNNWQGYEDLHNLILKKGHFFGNDDDCSNTVARKLLDSLAKWNNTENYLGKKWLFGNLIGYNEHHKFFGEKLKATPDGRFDGDMINFGIGQSQGKDRNGLTALLNSVAKCDPNAVLTGPSVTNVMIDEKLIKNDEYFEKLVDLFQTYFQNGGTHFQLSYVSKEDLINAKKTPEDYKNLRVRVSGFSDYFIFLNDALQDEIITRTVKKG